MSLRFMFIAKTYLLEMNAAEEDVDLCSYYIDILQFFFFWGGG